MNTIAKIGEERLQNVLLKDKKQNPKLILNLLKSEIANVLEHYMELSMLNADMDFKDGFFCFSLNAKARHIKNIQVLKS